MIDLASQAALAPVLLLNGKAYRWMNSIRYGLLTLVFATAIGSSLVSYYLFGRIGLGFLAISLAIMVSSGFVRNELIRDFSRLTGRKAHLSVHADGIAIDGHLRWRWDDILFCAPAEGDTHFDLLTERREAYFFVHAKNAFSDEDFETLKAQIRIFLDAIKPSALDPD